MDILNKESVISIFGYWPEFADAKLKKFSLESTNNNIFNIQLSIFYIDNNKNISSHIELLFSEVTELNMNEIKIENIIDNLSIKENNNAFSVTLEACYGVHGEFMCNHVEVVKVNA